MSQFLKTIDLIEAKLLKLWSSKSHREWTELCADTLDDSDLVGEFSEETILEAYAGGRLEGAYGANSFSDFTLPIKSNEKFRVELYFWNKIHTGIHNHPFYGAFICLKGKNQIFDFQFSPEKLIKGRREIALGELKRTGHHAIGPGDVSSIFMGEECVHNSFHSEPTVNLCVRTHSSNVPLYSYLPPHLRLRKIPLSENEMKHLELLSYLVSVESDNSRAFKKGLDYFDSSTKFFVLATLNHKCPKKLLDIFWRAVAMEKDWGPKALKSIKANDAFIQKLKQVYFKTCR